MADGNEKYKRLYQVLKTWMKETKVMTRIDSKSIISLDLSSMEDFHFIVPQVTKDLYWSLSVHKLLSIGKEIKWNFYPVLEAVYMMVFSPSPSGWNTGKDMSMEEGEKINFVARFIVGMVEENK